MDKLELSLELLDGVLTALDRNVVVKSSMPVAALRLAAAAVLVLVDIAASLREMLADEEAT